MHDWTFDRTIGRRIPDNDHGQIMVRLSTNVDGFSPPGPILVKVDVYGLLGKRGSGHCYMIVKGPSNDVCRRLDLSIASLDPLKGKRREISISLAYIVSANICITAGTHDNGDTWAGVDMVDIALDRNAKKKSRSVVGKFMRKLFR
jgi:hypothetical protein